MPPDMNWHSFPRLICMAILLAMLGTTAALAQDRAQELQLRPGDLQSIDQLPPGQLRKRLEDLPSATRQDALRTLSNISITDADIEYLRIDDNGAVYVVDVFPPAPPTNEKVSAVPPPTLAQVFQLHSKPGSANVVFIDFDGHSFSSAFGSYVALAYSTDSDRTTFNDTERAQIAEIWHRVAEDLAPFNIDVTTEVPTSFNSRTGRIVVTEDTDANGKPMPSCCNAGGVAYVNVFGTANYHTTYSPALVYANKAGPNDTANIAENASHEFGHNLGLSHDGTTTQNYYTGLGSGLISWAPIMGFSTFANVTQWSKGEYPNANQKQDDIAIIASKLGLRPDDHPAASLETSSLAIDDYDLVTSSNPENDPHNLNPVNKGVIGSREDIDEFSLLLRSGIVSLEAKPAWDAFYRTSRRGSNLDIKLELRNELGELVASSDPSTDTSAAITTSVVAGRYHLYIDGVSNPATPYSDYAGFGQFFIRGSAPRQPTLVNAIQIKASRGHSCALTSSGEVRCWGHNYYGEIGDGTRYQRTAATRTIGLSNGVREITVGHGFTCAIESAGILKCWGQNSRGQLGDGTNTQRSTPVQVTGITSAISIEGGSYHTCAIVDGGRVMCWGRNNSGQLGDGTKIDRWTPIEVLGMSGPAIQLAAGSHHSCALLTTGEVQCWGQNFRGQLGDGTTTDRLAPVTVGSLPIPMTKIAAGDAHTCAISSLGAAYCWGRNKVGQLGDGTKTQRTLPVSVHGLSTGVSAISAASSSMATCAIVGTDAIKCWGYVNKDQKYQLTPTLAQNVAGATDIGTDYFHTCVASNGVGRCWGLNTWGQLGDTTTIQRFRPVNVALSLSVPDITVSDVSVTEGYEGITQAVFQVQLSAPAPHEVSYSIQTRAPTTGAKPGEDYAEVMPRREVIAAGQTQKQFVVSVFGDSAKEGIERFIVEITKPLGANIADGMAIGIIVDDD